MRTEDILEAIETALTGLTTTTTNVHREQSYDIVVTELPHLVINEGEDSVEDQLLQSFTDWALIVDIDIVSRGDSDTAITQVNTIRGEVHAALMTDYQLGLPSVVQYIEPTGTSRPEVSIEGDKPIVRQRLTYTVKYRANWNNFN